LHVSSSAGLHYVRLKFRERLWLAWIFRNFTVLPQHVLSPRQRNGIAAICSETRLRRYGLRTERDSACVIGTVVLSVLPAPGLDRRRTARALLKFDVEYGVGREWFQGEGTDIGDGGIGFSGPKVYMPGMEITVRYRLRAERPWIKRQALVRHCDGNRMGIEFLDMSNVNMHQ